MVDSGGRGWLAFSQLERRPVADGAGVQRRGDRLGHVPISGRTTDKNVSCHINGVLAPIPQANPTAPFPLFAGRRCDYLPL